MKWGKHPLRWNTTPTMGRFAPTSQWAIWPSLEIVGVLPHPTVGFCPNLRWEFFSIWQWAFPFTLWDNVWRAGWQSSEKRSCEQPPLHSTKYSLIFKGSPQHTWEKKKNWNSLGFIWSIFYVFSFEKCSKICLELNFQTLLDVCTQHFLKTWSAFVKNFQQIIFYTSQSC